MPPLGTQVGQAARESEIPKQMMDLEHSIGVLQDAIGRLVGRVEPVLAACPPANPEKQPALSNMTGLGRDISLKIEKLMKLAEFVDQTTLRVEL